MARRKLFKLKDSNNTQEMSLPVDKIRLQIRSFGQESNKVPKFFQLISEKTVL